MLLSLLPQAGSTCADGEGNAQDYFTSFFSRAAAETDPSYRPFYYTQVHTFYDQDEYDGKPNEVNRGLLADWARYTGTKEDDVSALLFRYNLAALEAVRNSLDGKTLPDSLQHNAAVRQLTASRNRSALDYLVLAKKTEGQAGARGDEWEQGQRDPALLARLLGAAQSAAALSTDPFLKPRWAYQACKCAFYLERWAECLRLYDLHFQNASGALPTLARSYRAGALLKLKRNPEAALEFARAFRDAPFDRRGNYVGFLWSTNDADSSLLRRYVAAAPTTSDKAAMTALFGLYGPAPAIRQLETVYRLEPRSPLLPLLAGREVSKVEEQYLTPLLGRSNYFEDQKISQARVLASGKARASALAGQLKRYAEDAALNNRAFFAAAAAYLFLLDRQFDSSRRQLAVAEGLRPGMATQDQLKMLRLLLAANEPARLGPAEEAALLPAAEWLSAKAARDREYAAFERDFYSQLLAARYAKSPVRRTLVLSVADRVGPGTQGYYNYRQGFEVLHDELPSTEAQQLYALVNNPSTPWERYLVRKAAFNRNDVLETIGTAYIREGDFTRAIDWLRKADSLPRMQGLLYDADWNEHIVNVDPFYDHLNDFQRYEKRLPQAYTKLTFAHKMADLQARLAATKDPDSLAQLQYRLGTAWYNMSQYGNAWMAVSWYRGSGEWNEGNYKTDWQKDFFGVYRARHYFEQALASAHNREFKAACYFMMARCAQKQIPRPSWSANVDYKEMDRREAAFQVKFQNNPLFPDYVKQFGDTKFYQYSYKRCSYLRDFVKKNASPGKK